MTVAFCIIAGVIFLSCFCMAGRADRTMELFPDMEKTLSPREEWAIMNEVSTFLDENDRYTAESPLGVCRGHKTRAEAIDALADYLEADHGVTHFKTLEERTDDQW